MTNEIKLNRTIAWKNYSIGLKDLVKRGFIETPIQSKNIISNAHMFYIKTKGLKERTGLIEHLKNNNIWAVFHYVPLHSSKAGMCFGRFHGEDENTTKESERLIRLPMYYGIKKAETDFVIKKTKEYFK